MFVERINIAGNTRSEEKILRREIPMAEGDLFTTQKLARAKQKLTNLNYFETVNTATAPGATKDKIIVNIDVTEKPTGVFSIGGGYSSVGGDHRHPEPLPAELPRPGLDRVPADRRRREAPERDDQLHRALALRHSRWRRASTSTTGAASSPITRPTRSAGTSASAIRSASTRAGPRSTGSSQDTISDVAPNASVNLLDQEGTHLTSLIGARCHARHPGQQLRDDQAGATAASDSTSPGVGFGEQWFRVLGSTSYFFPIWRDHVLGVRGLGGYSLGWGSQPVPLFERFFLGGPNSIRSFKAQQVSPVDSSGTAIGGNIELLGNIEYTVPLFFGVRAAAFIDVGNVWGPDISAGQKFDITVMHYAAGMGLRWLSPFGPDSHRLRRELEPQHGTPGEAVVRELPILRGLGLLDSCLGSGTADCQVARLELRGIAPWADRGARSGSGSLDMDAPNGSAARIATEGRARRGRAR